jgi:uncharacterized protein YqgV (UPF0045/DUF77 family)
LLEFSVFPTDVGESKSHYVTGVVKVVKESGIAYQLTPMATIVECNPLSEAFDLVQKCYSVLKFDIRKNCSHRLQTKIQSIEAKIGEVSQ